MKLTLTTAIAFALMATTASAFGPNQTNREWEWRDTGCKTAANVPVMSTLTPGKVLYIWNKTCPMKGGPTFKAAAEPAPEPEEEPCEWEAPECKGEDCGK